VISHDITFLDFHFPLRGSPGQTLKKSHKGGRVTFLTNVIGTYRGVAQPAAGGMSDSIKKVSFQLVCQCQMVLCQWASPFVLYQSGLYGYCEYPIATKPLFTFCTHWGVEPSVIS